MKGIKIIFFDIDGTLIDMKKKCISEKVLETLIELKKNGIQICIATGRSPIELPHFPNVAFDAFLTYNGSYCFDRHRVIFSQSSFTKRRCPYHYQKCRGNRTSASISYKRQTCGKWERC